jgi:hypothetical protein
VKRTKRLARTSGLPRTGGLSRVTPTPRAARVRKPVRDTGPSRKVRALVLARDGYCCVCCGRPVIGEPYSLQHRRRRSQGGDNSPSNLVTVLGTGTTGCHQRIDSRRDPSDEAKGYTVRSWDDPALTPVMVFSPHGSGMTLWLTADGTYSTEPPEGAEAA